MIISHLIGGLGNQLFQFAAGRELSLRHNVPLALDLGGFEAYKLRNFDLDFFEASVRIAAQDEITARLPPGIVSKVIQYLKPKPLRTYHREHSYNFQPSIKRAGADVYLKGYFQSEKYFERIESVIREDFRIREQFILNVKEFASKLAVGDSVAIHIRRGDYLNTDVKQLLAEVPLSYYHRAIEMMKRTLPNARFCFFSDDIDWVRSSFNIAEASFVSGQTSQTHIEDFYLMSRCTHQVIGNSTFAWWAAWLNNNPSKKVIAPSRWFNDARYNRDRVPATWISL